MDGGYTIMVFPFIMLTLIIVMQCLEVAAKERKKRERIKSNPFKNLYSMTTSILTKFNPFRATYSMLTKATNSNLYNRIVSVIKICVKVSLQKD